MVDARLAQRLLHDTVPHNARRNGTILTSIVFFIGIGFSLLLIRVPCAHRKRDQYIEKPIVAMIASSSSASAAKRALLEHGRRPGQNSGLRVAAANIGRPAAAGLHDRLGMRQMRDQCAARRELRAMALSATAVRSGGGDDDVAKWIADAGMGQVVKSQSMGSSSWASFSRITTSTGCEMFVKSSSRSAEEMFKGEALGLQALYEATQPAGLMRIPKVYHVGDLTGGGGSFLIMEYMNFGGRGDDYALGRAMASMHMQQIGERPGRFGFDVDNTIGGTPQINTWSDDWIEFYRDRRLRYQVELAGDGYINSLFESIAPRLGELFKDVDVKPSVLHGDLWSGNIGSADGKPSIFDPAVYIGHHEAEWGMSWCASLSGRFWEGYREIIPEDPGFRARRPLYDAYHYLNHYNLFGGGYKSSAASALEQVKSALDRK